MGQILNKYCSEWVGVGEWVFSSRWWEGGQQSLVAAVAHSDLGVVLSGHDGVPGMLQPSGRRGLQTLDPRES